jgi:hypothetical protein
VVPEPAWRIGAYVAPEMRDIHLHVRSKLDVPDTPIGKAVWLSRSGIERIRRPLDELLLERCIAGSISVIHPETLSLAQQIGIFETADVVAGTIGSAFHTLLLARRVPRRVYVSSAQVASTFLAQEGLIGTGGVFMQGLAYAFKRSGPGRPNPYRLLVPETLRAIQTSLGSALRSDLSAALFANPERLVSCVSGSTLRQPRVASLDLAVCRVLLDPHSAEGRTQLGAQLEDAGDLEGAIEQFLSAFDASDEYVYAGLRAARLLRRQGERHEAALVAERILICDPSSREAKDILTDRSS